MQTTILKSFFAVLCLAGTAHAGGYVTANNPNTGTDSVSSGEGGIRFAQLDAGNSYCCEFYSEEVAEVFDVSTTISHPGGNLTAIDRMTTTPQMPAVILSRTGNRLCFTTTDSGTHNFTLSNFSNSPTTNSMYCDETSLYGGYNTNANPFNFLEISNLTNSTINGKITATNFDGTVVINGSDFAVEAGKRIDVSIHDAAGANVFGILKVTHDGPLGAIQANTSFYSGPVSALELKATVPATSRVRR